MQLPNPIPKTACIPTSGDLRPLVLQNSALKWVTATVLLQLKDPIVYLTPPEQRCFVPGLNLHGHLFLSHAMWRAVKSGLFVRTDFAKAFDSVCHVCASAFFHRMGLPASHTHTGSSSFSRHQCASSCW